MSVPLLAMVGGMFGGALLEWRDRRPLRKRFYEAALERARAVGKPLMVVGDPMGGMTHADYGYGDFCIDLTGCPGAPPGVQTAKVDLSVDRIPAADDSHVVFVCYVVECVPDIEHALSELRRVAGRAEDLIILALHPDEIAAWMYPGCRWLVEVQRDGQVLYAPIPRRARLHDRIAARQGDRP
jgi:hypothetical protein